VVEQKAVFQLFIKCNYNIVTVLNDEQDTKGADILFCVIPLTGKAFQQVQKKKCVCTLQLPMKTIRKR